LDERTDEKIVSLHECAERADDHALGEVETIADQSKREQGRDRFAEAVGALITDQLPSQASLAAGALRVTLRDIDRAPLPEIYTAAVSALRECDKIDETREWASKAEALASYARQAKDNRMRVMADRIQARAIRRCGELLGEIQAARGRRTDLELRAGTHPMLTRRQFATDAGLSDHQRKQALRIAHLPEQEFEAAVESAEPPSVTALAARGRRLIRVEVERCEIFVRVPVVYSKPATKTIEEISLERQLAVLMAVWRKTDPEARRRFLQNIGIEAG